MYIYLLADAVLSKSFTVNCVNMTLAIAKNDNFGPYSHAACSILDMSETIEVQNLTENECNNDPHAHVHAHTSPLHRFQSLAGTYITFCVVP